MDVDISLVDPSARDLFIQAEKFWEDRIQGYSTELPVRLRGQLTKLQITAVVDTIDGPGGILGFAGPETFVELLADINLQNQNSIFQNQVATTSFMQFDLDDFPELEANGVLKDVIIHEMGHALGIGSLWEGNGLLVIDFGSRAPAPQYYGKYGLQQYRIETGNLVAPFVPVEQGGGAGTALGHWNNEGFFNTLGQPNARKEMMTGSLYDVDPDDPTESLIALPRFLSRASLGSLADMGFAIAGVNSFSGSDVAKINKVPAVPFPIAPFASGTLSGINVRYGYAPQRVSLIAYRGAKGASTAAGDSGTGDDPYNLRSKRRSK